MPNSFRSWLGGDSGLRKTIDRSLAVITFDSEGRVLDANENFLTVTGYPRDKVIGQPHRMFMPPADADSAAYRQFWDDLRKGRHQEGSFRRIGAGGREIWLQSTYNPVLDGSGKVVRIVKIASDVTSNRQAALDDAGQIAAIHRSQAVIAFNTDGMILDANENFCTAMGYRREEIVGKHHRIFVDPAEAAQPDYARFWQSLREGTYQAAEYRRIAKGGRDIWIRATYNPILGGDGKPVKIVKFAVDVTAERVRNADYESQIEAIGRAQAVISFALDGTILDANENFLKATGYALNEIKGQHHRLFVEPSYASSEEYRDFWKSLGAGNGVAAIYQRYGKGGRMIWLQATYNPIMDAVGRPTKVVKYATDITANMEVRSRAVSTADGTLNDVEQVSTAAQTMSSRIDELAARMERSSEAVSEIADRAASADRSTAEMRQAAQSMDGVVQLIAKIAEQINLLALNATIEAARAGDAGRGFAVVAQEVKALASQASNATTKISGEISSMQSISTDVATTLGSIAGAIGEVRASVEAAATSIRDQSAVTRTISSTMQSTANGVASIGQILDEWIIGMEERRQEHRRRVSSPAVIHAGGKTIPCSLRNISQGGAKLVIAEGAAVPQAFLLEVAGEDQKRRCEIVRHVGSELGVRFTDVALVDSTPARLERKAG
jgi:methyl-accepting chemotaxis protein